MNWDALGAIAEIMGALGVIASLVYLSIQIRSNTRQLRFEATQTVAQSLDRAFDPIYVEPTASAWALGHQDYDSLDDVQKALFHGMMARQLHNLVHMIDAQSNDMIDKTRVQGLYADFYGDIFSTPGARRWVEANPQFNEGGYVSDILEWK